MTPKKTEHRSQEELFRSRVEQIIDLRHSLCQLANSINWETFIQEFGPLYVEEMGRPGLPIRLMVGLDYLKHLYGESDELVVAKYLENPYWQYFCGNEYFEHELPCNPTSLVKWRQRVKWEGIEKLFQESIQVAQRSGHLKKEEIQRVKSTRRCRRRRSVFPRMPGCIRRPTQIGETGQSGRDQTATKLSAVREAGFPQARPLWSSQTDAEGQACTAREPEIENLVGAGDPGY
jgi:hypothetical protein